MTRFSLAIPNKNIWMKSAGRSFQATLEVTMKVVDETGAEAWTFSQAFPLDIPQARLKEVLAEDFSAQAAATLKPGSYTLSVVVTNTTDGSKASARTQVRDLSRSLFPGPAAALSLPCVLRRTGLVPDAIVEIREKEIAEGSSAFSGLSAIPFSTSPMASS